MATSPGVNMSGGNPATCASQTNANSLAQCYANLLSGAAGLVAGPGGQKVLVLQSGDIQQASYTQTGYGNAAETWDEATHNQQLLSNIAAYCRANGIGIMVEADLTDTSNAYGPGTDALVENWGNAAAHAGLPIVSIEDVQEVGSNPNLTAADYARLAANEVLAVQTLIRDYAKYSMNYTLTAKNLCIGDMECVPYGRGISGPGDMHQIAAWWRAYNSAAASAGLQSFSYVTADTVWQAPWIPQTSSASWAVYLKGLSATAKSFGMSLNVDLQGIQTAASGAQFVRQVEYDAAWLATLQGTGGVNVASLSLVSWLPQSATVGMVSSSSSMTNAAAEITATYTLYQAGLITAQTITSTTAPGQLIVHTGIPTAFIPVSVSWDPSSVKAGSRLAVVLIDQTGLFTATAHGSGTVGGSGTNILVLSGNYADLSAELGTVRMNEPCLGPDTVDVQVFGTNGQLSDNQISVLTLPTSQGSTQFQAMSGNQGWLSASATVNTSGVMVSETLNWNTKSAAISGTSGAAAGQPTFVNTIAVHEPLAEFGVQFVGTLNGMVINAVIDIARPQVINGVTIASSATAANNPAQKVTPGSTWVTGNFHPAQMVTFETIASTVNTFDPSTGRLMRSVNNLAPSPKTLDSLQATTIADPYGQEFSKGGTQVALYNTGNNPDWYIGWGNQFSSVTLTYDGNGHLVERFFQGGPSNPSFTIDQVLDPNSGKLWEQFQAAPPPSPSTYANGVPGYVTGCMYVTQFNTGNNPNWNYLDWGTVSPANTELDTIYYTLQDTVAFLLSGNTYSYPSQFVNGTTLDLIGLPGTVNVNLNVSAVVIDGMPLQTTLRGITCVDAAGATGSVTLAGASGGGSTLIGGDNNTSITGFGHDTIIAGSGATLINTMAGGSIIGLAGVGARVIITGNGNVITTYAAGINVRINGTYNSIIAGPGGGATVTNALANATLFVTGNGFTITAVEGDTITATGTGELVNFSSSGTFVAGSGSTTATLCAAAAKLAVVNAGGTLTIAGDDDIVSASGTGTIAFIGTSGTLNSSRITTTLGIKTTSFTVNGDTDTINATAASNNITITGSGCTTLVVPGVTVRQTAANKNLNIVGDGATISATATSDSITVVGARNVVRLTGNYCTLGGSPAATTASLSGSYDTATLGNQGTLTVAGSACNAVLQQDASITITGTGNQVTAGARAVAAVSGKNNTVTVGSGSTVSLANQASGYNISIASGNIALPSRFAGTLTGPARIYDAAGVVHISLDPSATITIKGSALPASVALDGAGTIQLVTGFLKVQQPLQSGATIKLDGVVTLEMLSSTVSAGDSMLFMHQGGTLQVDAPGVFNAPISGFASGDRIDAAAVLYGLHPAISVTTDKHSYANLVLTDSSRHSSSFTLLGEFNSTGFHLTNDGHGGTAISYTG